MSSFGETAPESAFESSSQADLQATVEELRQELAFVCEVASVVLVSTTLDGTVRHAGPGVENVFGQSAEEVIDKNIRDLDVWTEKQVVEDILDRLRTEGKVWGYPARFLAVARRKGEMKGPDDPRQQVDEGRLLWIFDVEKSERNAFTDPLTGLPNRDLFLGKTERAIARSRRSETSMALLCLDVEDFAAVNEQFGHAVGDALLAEIASRLKEAVPELMPDRSTRQAERAMGTVARITGDRFALVLQECGKTKAERIGKKLRELLEVPFETSQGTVQLSANIGVAVWESNLPSPLNADELLRTAETALYEVKKEENRIYTFRPSDKIDAGRLRRREGLRQAIDEDELTLHYQPIVELEDRSVVEVEALVRWNHPEEGRLPPGQFIPLAEESGLAGALDRWVLREALRQVAEWRRTGRGPETVSVNVTVPTEGTGELEKAILQFLEQEDLAGEALTLELTERVAFRHTSPFEEFRNRGGRLAIDDFGTGHSALFYLRQFEADLLKIDQAFVEELDIADQTDVLVRASLEIANRLGMDAVAEGVETEAQLNVLRDLGCSFGQGYLFARPMPAHELEDLMEGRGEDV